MQRLVAHEISLPMSWHRAVGHLGRPGVDLGFLVAVEARRHLDRGRPAAVVPDVPAAAGVDDRPVPTLDGYDDLLEAGA